MIAKERDLRSSTSSNVMHSAMVQRHDISRHPQSVATSACPEISILSFHLGKPIELLPEAARNKCKLLDFESQNFENCRYSARQYKVKGALRLFSGPMFGAWIESSNPVIG
jgi:hypothetical protein